MGILAYNMGGHFKSHIPSGKKYMDLKTKYYNAWHIFALTKKLSYRKLQLHKLHIMLK